MKLLISIYCFLSCVIAVSVNAQRSASIICNENGQTRMDKATRWLMFFGEPNLQLPEDEKSLTKYCRDATVRNNFVKAYAARCLSSFPKQMTNLLMYGISRRNKYHCTSSKGKKEVKLMAKCGNKGKKQGNKCMNDMTDSFINALNAKDPKMRIPLMCCHYFKFEECIEREATNIGDPFCPPSSVKLVEETIYAFTGDLIRHICADFSRDSDKCEKDVLPFVPKKKRDQKNRPLSVLPAFIEVLESV